MVSIKMVNVLILFSSFYGEFKSRRFCELTNNVDLLTILMISGAPIMANGTLIGPMVFLVTGFHPFEHILEEILPDPKYRSISTIISIKLIKFVLLYLSCLESFRCGAYFYACVFVCLDRFRKILKISIISCKNAARMYRIHTEYYLLWRKLEDTMQLVVYTCLTFAFWSIVLLSWFCMICSVAQVGHFMYGYFLLGLCIFVWATILVVSLLSYLFHMDHIALKVNVIRAKKNVIRRRTWQNKITYLRTLASHQIKLKYGFFYYMEEDFFNDFFELLLLRCFDAIMIT